MSAAIHPRRSRRAHSLPILLALVAACSDLTDTGPPDCTIPDCPAPAPSPGEAIVPLTLATYDGSGQVVHPDIARATGLGAMPLWLGVTPYPGSDANFENPSIFQSRDGLAWLPPAGLANPVARPASGHLSDPDLVFDPIARELRLYYRQVAGGRNIVLLARSADGRRWSIAGPVVSAPSHSIVSPTIVRGAPGAPWQMWSVNGGVAGCAASRTTVERRTSMDGVHWSAPAAVELEQPNRVIWHLDVQWVPARREYWALYNAYEPGRSCVTPWLYLATSPDGIRWTTYPSPVLSRGDIDAFRDIVYRSTFELDASAARVSFWYSGAKYDGFAYVWRSAAQTRSVAGLLGDIRAPAPASKALADDRDLPPPEPGDL